MSDDTRLERIEQKLDKLVDNISALSTAIAVMDTEVKHHVRRSDRLEDLYQLHKEELDLFKASIMASVAEVKSDMEILKVRQKQKHKTATMVWKLALSTAGVIITVIALVCNNSTLLQAAKIWFAP
jgi:hypothetical protein